MHNVGSRRADAGPRATLRAVQQPTSRAAATGVDGRVARRAPSSWRTDVATRFEGGERVRVGFLGRAVAVGAP